MDAKQRRAAIIAKLKNTDNPLSGTALAREMGVSRQVIVGDIAILRAAGENILATPQGYVMLNLCVAGAVVATLACCHNRDGMQDELTTIIDNGGKVIDVAVEHPVYGEIRANLMLASRRDIAEFLQRIDATGAEPLSRVTGGVHLHTVEVPSAQALSVIKSELKAKGFLLN